MLIAWPASPTRKCPSAPSDDALLPATSWRSLRSWTVRPSRAPRARSCGGRACIPPISWSGAAPATPARWRHLARRVDASRPTRWPVRSSGCAGAASGWRPSWTGPGSSSPPREISPRSWRGCWPRAPRTRPSSDRADDRRAGPGGRVAAACRAAGRPRATHARHPRHSQPLPRPAPSAPRTQPRALSLGQRQQVLDVLHSERFCDQAPAEVYASLLDEGAYLASISTMYRLLQAQGEVGERRRQATHPATVKPELVADAPNRMWTLDITELLGS